MNILEVAADQIINEFLTKVTAPNAGPPPFTLTVSKPLVNHCRRLLKQKLEEIDAVDVERLITIESN